MKQLPAEISHSLLKELCMQIEVSITGIRQNYENKVRDAKSDVFRIEKRGTEIQNEAVSLALVMSGFLPTPQNSLKLTAAILSTFNALETKKSSELLSSSENDLFNILTDFLKYWNKLSQLSGFYKLANETPKALFGDWFSYADVHFMPTKKTLLETSSDLSIEKYVLEGWVPESPFVSDEDLVTALGSCFADELIVYLKENGFMTTEAHGKSIGWRSGGALPIISCSSVLVNTFVLLQQFEWAFENKSFSDDLWVGSKGEVTVPTEEMREMTRKIFQDTKLFAITLGLSEVWYRKDTGQVLWRAVPKEKFDPNIHGFKVSSVTENINNLQKIVQLISQYVPNATIVFTLSPVPLRATFRPISCITANSASKSILRVAVDELMRNNVNKNVYYWPSYEIVKEFHVDSYMEDGRHIKPEIVKQIMRLFHKYYLYKK